MQDICDEVEKNNFCNFKKNLNLSETFIEYLSLLLVTDLWKYYK